MKNSLIFLLLVSSFWIHAQVKIEGKVIDKDGKPLQGTSVYLNNTTVGTTSDSDGYFAISAEHGYYSLIASYVGFETSTYSLNTLELPNEIVFVMFEKENQLDEIVFGHKISSNKRAFYLSQFRKNFLGQSFIAQKASIKNEYAIKFEYDEVNEILEARAIEPLIIMNKGLGYKITYDLVHFQLQPEGVTYLGYTRYENLEGKPRKMRKWQEEREIAYNGSLRHFLTSAIHMDSLAGFEVDLVRLIPNPERPPEQAIIEAEALIAKYGGLQRNPYNSDPEIEKKLKLANEIVRKAEELNRFIHITIMAKVPIQDYFEKTEDGMFLFNEEEAMRIRYRNEYQEDNYKSPDKTYTTEKHQISRITLYDERVLVNSKGLFHNPLDALLEGYWSFEKVADKIPLNYKPKDNLHK